MMAGTTKARNAKYTTVASPKYIAIKTTTGANAHEVYIAPPIGGPIMPASCKEHANRDLEEKPSD